MPGNPYSSQVHIDSALTNMSVAYMQDQKNFIADQVFPIVPVQKKSDRYFVYNKGDFFRDEALERAAGTESAGGGYDIDNTPSYFAHRYAYHKDVTDEDRDNADTPLKPDEDATQFVTQKMLLRREAVFVSKYLNTGVWGTNVQGVASGESAGTSFRKWSDYTASNPGKDIRYLKSLILGVTGFEPNVLTISYDVYSALLDHPIIKDNIKYVMVANPGQVASILAQYFDVEKVVVAKSVVNSAAKGATDNIGFAVSNRALLSYSAPNPGIKQPSAGYIFAWTGLLGSGAYGNRIVKFPVPLRGIETVRVEGEMCFDAKAVGADLGAYLYNVI
ncbi:hypothetical protein [Pectinatus frisingensis]|uniref:hypothetical protein n=1 Tax=Pectinatus frisingensis TaxID=865 RepID=UPI0018C745C7|nr:hypothetical protein [Pectinatus frisingensis]